MESEPSTNCGNGRKANGQFAKGNPGGPGNPYARHVAHLRASLIEAVGDDGLADIVQGMVTAAKGGDVAAAGVFNLGDALGADSSVRLVASVFGASFCLVSKIVSRACSSLSIR